MGGEGLGIKKVYAQTSRSERIFDAYNKQRNMASV